MASKKKTISSSTKKISNPFNVDYLHTDAHGLLAKVKAKYDECFDAADYIKKDTAIEDANDKIIKLNNTIRELEEIASSKDEETYTLKDVEQVPMQAKAVLNELNPSGKSGKPDVIMNLQNGVKQIAASYFQKEQDDISKFILYAKSVYNLCDTKKTKTNAKKVDAIKLEIKKYYTIKANKKMEKAKFGEKVCKESYDVVMSIHESGVVASSYVSIGPLSSKDSGSSKGGSK